MKNKIVSALLLLFLVIILIACAPAGTAGGGPFLTLTPYERGFVYVETTSNNVETSMLIGQQAIVKFSFHPMIWSREEQAFVPWLHHPVVEIRTCFAVQASIHVNCPQNWKPFEEGYEFTFPVDWAGERFYVFGFQFRDANGKFIRATTNPITPTIDRSVISEWVGPHVMSVVGIYDPKTPISALPTQVRADVAASETATVGAQAALDATASATMVFAKTHVTGGIIIPGGSNDGGGQSGAKPGSTLLFDVRFYATSPFAEVTEMRMVTDGSPIESAPWEPYQTTKPFTLEIPVANFFGLGIDVQYRDAQGNLSPVYSDSIVVEGWPP